MRSFASTMATTEVMYEGTTRKADLVRNLRERDYPDNTARPIAKWRIKVLVQALIQTDVGRNGDVEDCEDEDSDDHGDSDDDPSHEGANGDVEDCEDEDSDDDGDSDDDPSHERANESSHEGANEGAADNTTALGFLKLLHLFRAPNSNLVKRIRREYEITPL